VLVCGSLFVIANSTYRIFVPKEINYDGMLIFAIIGVAVNFIAAFITKDGDSLNQKAVNLHMLEDVLGWIVVLVGSIVMKFTNFAMIDSIMSISIGIFILINAIKNVKETLDVLLEKGPRDIHVHDIIHHIKAIDGVVDVHHVHVWTLDGNNHCGTLHVVAKEISHDIKHKIREEFHEHGIEHITIEMEKEGEECHDTTCEIHKSCSRRHNHRHPHHGHHH
jgi:cobalt-zinc-cadmium efflux system protein